MDLFEFPYICLIYQNIRSKIFWIKLSCFVSKLFLEKNFLNIETLNKFFFIVCLTFGLLLNLVVGCSVSIIRRSHEIFCVSKGVPSSSSFAHGDTSHQKVLLRPGVHIDR